MRPSRIRTAKVSTGITLGIRGAAPVRMLNAPLRGPPCRKQNRFVVHRKSIRVIPVNRVSDLRLHVWCRIVEQMEQLREEVENSLTVREVKGEQCLLPRNLFETDHRHSARKCFRVRKFGKERPCHADHVTEGVSSSCEEFIPSLATRHSEAGGAAGTDGREDLSHALFWFCEKGERQVAEDEVE